jgi:2-methylcitrate dehydratase PrpD
MMVGERLAHFAASVAERGLPADLRVDAARRVLDVIGNSLAATAVAPARAVRDMVARWGGPADATAIGYGLRVPAPAAALVNGTLAHALDFDDTHLPSVLHPSSPVVAAALAVAESRDATGPQLLDAVGAGVEITVRLGMAGYDETVGSSVFLERGLHATAICGTIGAAAAAAMLAGLPADEIGHAMGIAASMGAGLLEANRTSGTVKPLHCGWAAHSGVVAADLAAHGMTGPPTVFEGRFGFLRAFCGDRYDVDAIFVGLGTYWELPGIFVKPYPCNHFTHAGIDAALRLRAAGLAADDIADVELGVPTPVLRSISEPREEKTNPRSGYHAASSGPYTVAAALLGGGGLGLSHEDFTDEAAADGRRLALAAKVRCVPDQHCDQIFPHQFPAVLRIRLHDGSTLEERVDVNRGGPDNPLSTVELSAKFRLNATRSLSERAATVVAEATLALPAAPGVRQLMALTYGSGTTV